MFFSNLASTKHPFHDWMPLKVRLIPAYVEIIADKRTNNVAELAKLRPARCILKGCKSSGEPP